MLASLATFADRLCAFHDSLRFSWSHSVVPDSLRLHESVIHSTPGPSVHGVLQARILEWVSIPSPRDLPDPGTEPVSPASPASAGGFFTTEPPGKPFVIHRQNQTECTTKAPSAKIFSFDPCKLLKPEEIEQLPKCSLRITH